MPPTPPGQRNRAQLVALLSTRARKPADAHLPALADTLEDAGYIFAGWTVDGPGVQVRFHGGSGTVAASLDELRAAAQAQHAGDTTAWRSLLLQDDPNQRTDRTSSTETFP